MISSESAKPNVFDSSTTISASYVRGETYFAWQRSGDLRAMDIANKEVIFLFYLKPGNVTALSPTESVFAASQDNNVEIWLISEKSVQVSI